LGKDVDGKQRGERKGQPHPTNVITSTESGRGSRPV
jgi:hypothetical protein